MRTVVIVGMLLIGLGLLSLFVTDINYVADERVIDLGPVETRVEQKRSIPVPPYVGGILILAGAGLVWYGTRRSA